MFKENFSKHFLWGDEKSTNGKLVVGVGALDIWDPFMKGIVT